MEKEQCIVNAYLQYSKTTIGAESNSGPHHSKISTEITPTATEITATDEDEVDTTFIDNMVEAYLNHTKSNDLVNKVRIADVYTS